MVDFLERGTLQTKVERWVIRKDVEGMAAGSEEDEQTESIVEENYLEVTTWR